MIRIAIALACCLSLSSCGYHDYTVAAQAIAEAQMRSDERMVEIAAEAGRTGNIAGAMAAGYMIGSRSCNRSYMIEAPDSGVDYLSALARIGMIGLGFAAIETGGDVLIEAFRSSGGNVTVGHDSIGGDYTPAAEEEEIISE